MLNDPDHTQIPNNMSKDVELKKSLKDVADIRTKTGVCREYVFKFPYTQNHITIFCR